MTPMQEVVSVLQGSKGSSPVMHWLEEGGRIEPQW